MLSHAAQVIATMALFLAMDASAATHSLNINGLEYYQQWGDGADPDKIVFRLNFTNQFVSTSSTVVPVAVSNGVPTAVAILVDSTNTAGASWSAYTGPNIPVNLGPTEGWHDVRIGLTGRLGTSQPTWHMWRLKYDPAPPALVFTNLPAGPIAQPMLQLQGYSTKALLSLRYDLSNSAGLATNQLVLVLKTFYDTNTWEITTNWFQAFDVPLAVGTNILTVHAIGLAGTANTTNLSVVLDYSGHTTPPAITLYWPKNGAQISGDKFTWRGQLDDFTASVTAQIADANGNTNTVNGLVERDGNFWIENLPLAPGTNALTLTAVDAAGNSSRTNISVVQSSVHLTIDPLSWTNSTVTGTIDSADYTVWVNGVKATRTGANTWSAANVPLEHGGTAVVQVRAIPNTDNGGNGTRGGEGTGTSYPDPGNPRSMNPQDAGTYSERPFPVKPAK